MFRKNHAQAWPVWTSQACTFSIYISYTGPTMLGYIYILFFFLDSRKPTLQKAHFVGPDERVKPRLSQTLTRGARPDSNSSYIYIYIYIYTHTQRS
jgi:hypothetical protein